MLILHPCFTLQCLVLYTSDAFLGYIVVRSLPLIGICFSFVSFAFVRYREVRSRLIFFHSQIPHLQLTRISESPPVNASMSVQPPFATRSAKVQVEGRSELNLESPGYREKSRPQRHLIFIHFTLTQPPGGDILSGPR